MSDVKPIPDGVPVVMPMLVCRDAAAEIDFCTTTFGALELLRRPAPDGTVAHAAIAIGGAMIMIEAEWPSLASRAPQLDGSSSVVLYVYVEDVDTVTQNAVSGGAKLVRPVKDEFSYGDRTGTISDPFGQIWSIATHIEDVSPEEMKKRMAKAMSHAATG